jgi:hypothetical protein
VMRRYTFGMFIAAIASAMRLVTLRYLQHKKRCPVPVVPL